MDLIEKKDFLETKARTETCTYLKKFYLNALQGTLIEIEKFKEETIAEYAQ